MNIATPWISSAERFGAFQARQAKPTLPVSPASAPANMGASLFLQGNGERAFQAREDHTSTLRFSGQTAPSAHGVTSALPVREHILNRGRSDRHLGSTYRLQTHPEFTLEDTSQTIPYLKELGVQTAYTSPLLKSISGSSHGYNMTDPTQIDPDRGGMAEFLQFSELLKANNMKLMLDIVPNHMGIGPENPWWWDVLKQGEQSRFASFFDINWHGPDLALQGKVLLPILGAPLEEILQSGQLQIQAMSSSQPSDPLVSNAPTSPEGSWEKEYVLRYYEHTFPLNKAAQAVIRQMGAEDAFNLRKDDSDAIKQEKLERLKALLDHQHYQLDFWRNGPQRINYRRFFDINDLAAVRMENPAVFEATHRLILSLIAQGRIHGLRVDHVDGLTDPAGYLAQLQKTIAETYEVGSPHEQPVASNQPVFPVLVEKILAPHEQLPTSWPVEGTSGYDALNDLNGLFIDTRHGSALSQIYGKFINRTDLADASNFHAYEALLTDSKLLNLNRYFQSDLDQLTTWLHQLSRDVPRSAGPNSSVQDYTFQACKEAIRRLIVNFPVYRTYVAPCAASQAASLNPFSTSQTNAEPSLNELVTAYWRTREATNTHSGLPEGLLDWITQVLTLQVPNEQLATAQQIAGRFQQLSSTVMAKGMEDTFMYRYNRLASLNEVGGEPDYVTPIVSFHLKNLYRLQHHPNALITTSTHDTKRSADVRARLNALSEMPQSWEAALAAWNAINASAKTLGSDPVAIATHQHTNGATPTREMPDRNDEYLLYQTLLGIWPDTPPNAPLSQAEKAVLRDRVGAYMIKALREAKVHTSWTENNQAYEGATLKFIDRILENEAFLASFRPFQQRISQIGKVNSLAQLLLKMTVPGVPDTYQGEEDWNYSLVDPDNRRPVDYTILRQRLKSVQQTPVDRVGDKDRKLLATHRLLALRSVQPDLFAQGDYIELEVSGPASRHIISFARRLGAQALIVVAPRLVGNMLNTPSDDSPSKITRFKSDAWKDTFVHLPDFLAENQWKDLWNGQTIKTPGKAVSVSDCFAQMPIGALVLT